jgi:hypothetical protein
MLWLYDLPTGLLCARVAATGGSFVAFGSLWLFVVPNRCLQVVQTFSLAVATGIPRMRARFPRFLGVEELQPIP